MKHRHNNYIPYTYQLELVRNRTREVLMREYMIFVVNLYGHLIQDGTKKIRDYANMSMIDMREELILRTRAMRGSNNRKIKEYKEKEQKRQDELLRKLSQLN